MTARYADFVNEVLPTLSADPSDPVTESAIRRAVAELCARSWVWKFRQDPVDVQAGVSEYALEPPYGSEVVAVTEVSVGGVPLSPSNVALNARGNPQWRIAQGAPLRFFMTDTTAILLSPTPDTSAKSGLEATMALKPSADSVEFPAWIANRYLYDIVDGALAHLMLMQNKPWTNLQMGADCRSRFSAGIANARASAVTSMDAAPLRTTPGH